MQFEVCEHEVEPVEPVMEKDDLDRWRVDVTCPKCGAEGYVILGEAPVFWDKRTLPEIRDLMERAGEGNG